VTSPSACVAIVRDNVLDQPTVDKLLTHAIKNESGFVEAPLIRGTEAAAPVVVPEFRRNRQLRGADSVPENVMRRIHEFVPELAAKLPDVNQAEVAHGTYEVFITATPDGGFFRPHVDASHDGARDRFISFVLFFSFVPRPFAGGELCIERDWRDEDRIFIFDPSRNGLTCEIAEIIEPMCNRLVVFRAHRRHEVKPVRSRSHAFQDSRFAVTGFVRSRSRAT
jgi:Rps23 Pro-64 3,4-dihydroxylase Tpa1-like proline 4-hydroxylase